MSLVAGKEKERAEAVELALSGGDEAAPSTPIFKPYKFRMEELDGFRYRALDAWRSVTRIAIREARLKEIKQEMLNSSKLQSHFADNPRDLNSLRHDKALHTVQHQVCPASKLNKLFLKRLDKKIFLLAGSPEAYTKLHCATDVEKAEHWFRSRQKKQGGFQEKHKPGQICRKAKIPETAG